MKYIGHILSLLLVAAGFVGCDELDKTYAVDGGEIVKPVMNPVGSIVIKDNNKEEEVTFSWSAADFGYSAKIDYTIHAVCDGEEGKGDVELFSGINETSYATTKGALNLRLCASKEDGGLGLPEYATVQVEFYVMASIGKSYTAVKSEASVVSEVTTAQAVTVAKGLYIPGSHQGWAPADAQMIFESNEKDVYIGFIDLNTEDGSNVEFKFTTNPDWNGTNYGGALDALDNDGGAGNLTTASGFYYATVNLANMNVTLLPMVPGLIGSFNDWGGDEPMVYDWSGKSYSATVDLSENAEIKVRFNGGWDYNFGGDINDLSQGGANIVVAEAGTYVVKFFYNYETLKYCLSYEKQ